MLRHFRVYVAQYVGAYRRIKSKAIDTSSGCVYQNRGRAIEDIPSCHLSAAGLQDGLESIFLGFVGAPKYREDRAYVDIDIRGAVQRVKDNHVLGCFWRTIEDDWFFVFFRHKSYDTVAHAETMKQSVVRIDIKLLLCLA